MILPMHKLSLWKHDARAKGPSIDYGAVDMPRPGSFILSHIADWAYIYDYCPLPGLDVGMGYPCRPYIRDFEYTSFHMMLVCAAARLFCMCFFGQVYYISGSTQELYTFLFKQMARLLLKISRYLAYAAQPAAILRCPIFFLDAVELSQIGTHNLRHFLSAHCSRLLGCCL